MAHSDPTRNTKTSISCLVPCKWLCPECPIFTWNALGVGRALAGFCAKGWFGSHHNVHLLMSWGERLRQRSRQRGCGGRRWGAPTSLSLRASYYPNTGPSTSKGHLAMKRPLQDSASKPGLRHKTLPPCAFLSPHRSQLAAGRAESCLWLLLPSHSCRPTGLHPGSRCHPGVQVQPLLAPWPPCAAGPVSGPRPFLTEHPAQIKTRPGFRVGGWETIVGVPSSAWAWACDPSSSTKLLWTSTPQPCQRAEQEKPGSRQTSQWGFQGFLSSKASLQGKPQ